MRGVGVLIEYHTVGESARKLFYYVGFETQTTCFAHESPKK